MKAVLRIGVLVLGIALFGFAVERIGFRRACRWGTGAAVERYGV